MRTSRASGMTDALSLSLLQRSTSMLVGMRPVLVRGHLACNMQRKQAKCSLPTMQSSQRLLEMGMVAMMHLEILSARDVAKR